MLERSVGLIRFYYKMELCNESKNIYKFGAITVKKSNSDLTLTF